MSSSEIENHLKNVLSKSTNNNLNLSNEFTLNIKSSVGNGFVGQFYKVSVEDETTKAKYDIVAKKAPSSESQRKSLRTDLLYDNEIYFYETLLPALKKFGNIEFIPGYIASERTENEEIIVLDDISAHGYIMRDKSLLLDDEHVELIFATYGRFHALSFVWRDKNLEEYQKFINPINNVLVKIPEAPFGEMICAVCQRQEKFLDPVKDAELLKAYQKYIDDPKGIFQAYAKYEGKYSAILHGDCWSNNLMFKYEGSKPVDMKLLDFQMLHEGTPVYDLSYFFYTGGTKEHFDRLEYYLDIYHKNFSDTVRTLGSDPEKLFPREKLTEDWKGYSKMGMFLSLLPTRVKHINMEDTIKYMQESAKVDPGQKKDLFMSVKCDEEAFARRVRDVVSHLNDINAL